MMKAVPKRVWGVVTPRGVATESWSRGYRSGWLATIRELLRFRGPKVEIATVGADVFVEQVRATHTSKG